MVSELLELTNDPRRRSHALREGDDLLRQHDHAGVKIFRLRVQPWRGEQLLSLAVVQINVAFPLTTESLRDKHEKASIGTQRRRVFVRCGIEAGQRRKLVRGTVEQVDVAATTTAWPIGGERDQVAVGA